MSTDRQSSINQPRCRLYLITPPEINDPAEFAQTLDTVFNACSVACLQLRLKDYSDDQITEVAGYLMPVCDKYDVAFILNDRVDLALEIGADGVHLGQNDMPVKEAREILGKDANIGVTCHDSIDLAFQAGEGGADYVAFGAFFETTTKDTRHRPDVNVLTVWDEITELPAVAIGGITPENCAPLVDAGAHFLAVSSGVWNYKDGPVAAAKAFSEKLMKARSHEL